MAKKQEESIVVLRRMTRATIVGFGVNIVLKKHMAYWIGLAVASFVWVIIVSNVLKANEWIVSVIGCAPLVLTFIGLMYSANKAGKKLWESIKDKEQPVKLEL